MSSARVLLAVLLTMLSQPAAAQPAKPDCLDVQPEKEQLACFVQEAQEKKRKAAEEAAKNQPQPVQFTLQVRDTSTSVADFRGFELGQKGGSISTERDHGEDTTNAKIAVFGKFPARFGGRIQPFVGASWLRKGAQSTRSDIRDFTIGSVGPLWESSGEGSQLFSLLTTLQLTHREDRFGTSEGNLARAQFDLVWVPLASGRLLGGVSLVPHIGLLAHRRTGGGIDDGTWASAYAGVALGKSFGRFQTTLLGRRLHDANTPSGNGKRRDHYASLSFDYYFFDPENKKAPFQPSVFITREVGNDFLTGVDNANKTTGGLRVKFN